MDAKLRDLLRRHGVSEEALDKIERREPPDDPVATLRKLDPHSPALAKIEECHALIAKIRDDLDKIQKADATFPFRPVLRFNETNGHPSTDALVAALSKNRGDMR